MATQHRQYHVSSIPSKSTLLTTILLCFLCTTYTSTTIISAAPTPAPAPAPANIICTSPSSHQTIQSGKPITLGFSGKGFLELSVISADLICSGSNEAVLALGSKYDAVQTASSKAPSVIITAKQAASALAACPSNKFHVQYTLSSLLDENQIAKCDGILDIQTPPSSIEAEAIELELPIPLPTLPGDPSPEPTQPSSPAATSTQPASEQPQPTTPAPSPPAANPPPTDGNPQPSPSPTTKPPKPSRGSQHPPTVTPPPSGGGGNGGGSGGNKGGSKTSPAGGGGGGGGNGSGPSNPSPTSPDSSSSDLQSDNASSGLSSSTARIAGTSAGIVAAIFVILAVLLVWRKRQQRKSAAFNDLFSDSALNAAKPIFARSNPDEEVAATGGDTLNSNNNNNNGAIGRTGSVLAPMSSPAQPPPLISREPSSNAGAPYEQYDQYDQYDHGYHHQGLDPNGQYTPQREPSYGQPYHQPAYENYGSYNHHG
ncbi:hypothetical protein BX616_002808 [Lobosporangium transversale]|uniref:Uncharacterized protein n=1 Tax=Lobosporangium transversale TaxID=64571 RepID=A0A1Y2GKK9_9FUNG|nr:hypothetical protein BCR41DRAFT_423363 [Lobosporangium transversale]KAF9899855.1 hypothetical protein BX616_002808 [Lobosporangium transversale]ORZ12187.1 hypothetical protein BCR41DRAFT_423363 [Lobosporangium transversale]|eukprot:XP_021880052.1 hypothetical protein BCR41DRAFT_423363 [Lobosporangium transversale]